MWGSSPCGHDTVMLWAACCRAFFRIGEMAVPSDDKFDSSCHLIVKDVAIDNPKLPTVVRVTIKQSKTDPFRRGVDLFLGKTDSDLCPVQAILSYLRLRGRAEGPIVQV